MIPLGTPLFRLASASRGIGTKSFIHTEREPRTSVVDLFVSQAIPTGLIEPKVSTAVISRCPSIPCYVSAQDECLWTDWVTEKNINGRQAKHYACIKRSDGSCAWGVGHQQALGRRLGVSTASRPLCI
ncbi:Metalloproteinase inhibitor 2 [Varanus komodoensis]|nr:Metalloproteinase inhibitor 2 [Varanus komodoensis]